MTATLLEKVRGFNIIGLLDRDEKLIGKTIYGMQVISKEQAEEQADILIINTSESYWNVIYNRIKNWKIPIYFKNGQRASEQINSDDHNIGYWNKTYLDLENSVDSYDMVSFDIFDTLIIRKVLYPIDVFNLTEKKLKNRVGENFEFITYRKKASALLIEPTIDEIYEKMRELMGCSKEFCDLMKKCELETEQSVIVGREDIIKFCKGILNKKEVYFISDMYYSSSFLQKLLQSIGIAIDRSRILVSCEHKKSKEKGDLWEYYKNTVVKEQKAIHIGDNKKVDCIMAKQYGIDSFYIMSAIDMLKNSSIQLALPKAITEYASLVLGLCIARIFNSPFALHGTKGIVKFKDPEEAGYCLFGNIAYSFLLWVLKQSKQDEIEELLFFAREGYLIIEQYQYLLKLINENGPHATYLEISRRAIMAAAVSKKEDIYELSKFPYDGTVTDFFKDRLGVTIEDTSLNSLLMADIQKDEKKLFNILDSHMDKISHNIGLEKKGYQKYFNGLKIKDKFAIIDSVLYGNTQYYLGKFLDKSTKGYYFSVCLDSNNICIKDNEMKGCFQKETDYTGRDTAVFRYASALESFFTSPEGMLICIKEDGTKTYAKKMSNQENFDVRYVMQKGVFQFFRDIMAIQTKRTIDYLAADEQYADYLFGCFMNNGFLPSKEMKRSFFYDNGMLNHKEVPIWE